MSSAQDAHPHGRVPRQRSAQAEISSGELTVAGRRLGSIGPGAVEVDGRTVSPESAGLEATWAVRRVAGRDVWEASLDLVNTSDRPVVVTRMDACALGLDCDDSHWVTRWYRSAWGDEFRPESGTTRHDTVLDVRSGRSAHGMSPWLALEAEDDRGAVIVSPAWSGNWHIRALSGGQVSAGISPWRLGVELAPGESVTAPSVVIAVGTSLDKAAVELQRAVAGDWLARSDVADAAPAEWNHWWPYEDVEVTEEVIAANAAVAAELGIDIVTVDAGWFGEPDAGSDWQEQRGDWDRVNTARFPSGLAELGRSVRAAGASPGIWIEAEAVGRAARLRQDRPEALARADGRRRDPSYRVTTVSLDADDPGFLGYVCLGSEAGRDHVRTALREVVEAVGARWVKLDFNIDPDGGCTRTDHGHGSGDGLLRHYQGLYAVLREFRESHPEVILEACASGGLRLDLGLAREVHGFFLSDPDYTEHHLQVLHGAAHLLPPLGILHWSQSQWRGDYPPQQRDWDALSAPAFDTMLRAAMLHRFGVSLRLTELRSDLRDRLAAHVGIYRGEIAPMLVDAVLVPLTGAPLRDGRGERAPAFQLSSERTDTHVLAAFVLAGGRRPAVCVPRGLDPARHYLVTDLAEGTEVTRSGAELLREGVALPATPDATSWLIRLRPASSPEAERDAR